MKIAMWSDGYVLDGDPRREDPLFYYLKDEIWALAVGFEAEPLYEVHRVEKVTVGVWRDHLPREAALHPGQRRQMYLRVIPALTAHFKNWKCVTIRGEGLAEVISDLSAVLATQKFRIGSCDFAKAIVYKKG